MQFLSASFGVATVAASAIAFRGHSSFAPRFLSVFLVAAWAVTNVLWQLDSLAQLVTLDMLTVLLVMALPKWRGDAAFFQLGLAQLALDTLYQWFGVETYMGYMALYNLAFAAQLVIVASTGMPDVVSRMVDYWRRRVSGA